MQTSTHLHAFEEFMRATAVAAQIRLRPKPTELPYGVPDQDTSSSAFHVDDTTGVFPDSLFDVMQHTNAAVGTSARYHGRAPRAHYELGRTTALPSDIDYIIQGKIISRADLVGRGGEGARAVQISLSPNATIEHELKQLEDNWDGEGAPKPTDEAIRRAMSVLAWAESRQIKVLDVDADVLGGVGVRLRGSTGTTLWIACMNSKKDTAVWSEGMRVKGHSPIESDNYHRLDMFLSFLGNTHGKGR
jgi:hypothetical protein